MPLTSGAHLRVVREWIQRKFINGDRVTWGSLEHLSQRGSFTVLDLETLAEDIKNSVLEEHKVKPVGYQFRYSVRCLDKGPLFGVADSPQEIWNCLFRAEGRVAIYDRENLVFIDTAEKALEWVKRH